MAYTPISSLDQEITLRVLARDLIRTGSIIQNLKANRSSATVNRLFKSKHVLDLKLILSAAVYFAFVATLVLLIFELADHYLDPLVNGLPPTSQRGLAEFFDRTFDGLFAFIKLIGPIFAALGVVAAWTYRSAATRLGIVSLFAGEITELCRVGTVFDVARRLGDTYEATLHAGASQNTQLRLRSIDIDHIRNLSSQEEYFPVFSGNSRDLELLEAKAVTRIAAFYTYMKAMRDLLRKLGNLEPIGGVHPERDDWHHTLKNVIYMIFLSYEKAREIVGDLIEYEPDQYECIVMILVTEIEAFGFLRKHFSETDDPRSMRLALRVADYRKWVPDFCRQVAELAETDPRWEKASTTAREVRARYSRVFQEEI